MSWSADRERETITVRRVLQVIASTDRRGAEVFATDLAGELRARGLDVETRALALGMVGGLDVEPLGRHALRQATLRVLRRRARGFDVVVAHGSATLPACALALAGTRVPWVYRNIGDPRHWSRTPLRRARVGFALRRAAAVVAIAEAARDELVAHYGVPPTRITVIPTGVDASRFTVATPQQRFAAREMFGIDASTPLLVVVGALSMEKQVAVAVDALGQLPDTHLLVVGDGPERASLEARARHVAPSRVHFTGVLADPRPAYAAADLVVCTSRTEGLPAALVEAGLSGRAVVTTDVGYVREVVEDGVTGVVVPPGDSAALVAGIRRALQGASVLGLAARSRCADRFALDHVATAWYRLLSGR
jgi:glycosyltransferase involved in cell wall biosynthesis